MTPAKTLVCLLLLSIVACLTPQQNEEHFNLYDKNIDQILDAGELKEYYKKIILKGFENVDIDPKIIEKGVKDILKYAANPKGLNLKQFLRARTPIDPNAPKPIFTLYPEEDL